MLKISSKFVPVVAAVALLAGVFSVASVQAATLICQVDGPATNGSCNTGYQNVPKNECITIKTSVDSGSSGQSASAIGYLKRSDGVTVHTQSVVASANDWAQKAKNIKNTTTKTQSYRGELKSFKGGVASLASIGTDR